MRLNKTFFLVIFFMVLLQKILFSSIIKKEKIVVTAETKYGSISGQVTDQDSGLGIPKVKVQILNNEMKEKGTTTNDEGRYLFEMVTPGEYSIFFFPELPYYKIINLPKIYVKPGEKVIFNKTLEVGGSITGKVYKGDDSPFEGVKITVPGHLGTRVEDRTKADGSYSLKGVCPSKNCFIRASVGIPGIADRILTGIEVSKGKETIVKDIIINLNDVTGIEGYITSAFDGGPIENASASIKKIEDRLNRKLFYIGDFKTDKNGYFYIKNLEPGDYSVSIRPAIPPRMDEVTGKAFFRMNEYTRFFVWKNVIIKKDRISRYDMKLHVPAKSKTIKTEVEVHIHYGENLDEKPIYIVLNGLEQGTHDYTKEKIVADQSHYYLKGVLPGKYGFGLSFIENRGGQMKEKIYYSCGYPRSIYRGKSQKELHHEIKPDNEICILWNYRVIISVYISGEKIFLPRKVKKKSLGYNAYIRILEKCENRLDRTLRYKIKIVREVYEKPVK